MKSTDRKLSTWKHTSLLKSSRVTNSNTKYFCSHEGFIHASYCQICQYHNGDPTTARLDPEQRSVYTCKNVEVPVGELDVGSKTIHFTDQQTFKKEVAHRQYIDVDYHSIKVPIKPSKIKNFYHTKVSDFDFLRWNKDFCGNCGKKRSGAFHLACLGTLDGKVGCGTRQLCENCVRKMKRTQDDQGLHFVTFNCPKCKKKTELGLGNNENGFTKYQNFNRPAFIGEVYVESKLAEVLPNPFVEIDYHSFYDSLRLSHENDERLRLRDISSDLDAFLSNEKINRADFIQSAPPLKQPKYGFIREGLMRGAFVYSLEDQRVFVYHSHTVNEALRRVKSAREIQNPQYDFIISYAEKDLKFARSLKEQLSTQHRVYLLDLEKNIGDQLWSIRYREALYYSTYFIPIISADYLRRPGSALEFYEALKISRNEEKAMSSNVHFILPIFFDRIPVSKLRKLESRWSRDWSELESKEKRGRRLFGFNKDTFSWDLIPFYVSYNRRQSIDELVEFFGVLGANSNKQASFLRVLNNQFLGFRDHPLGRQLVFQSIMDPNVVHLLTMRDQDPKLRWSGTEGIKKLKFNRCSLDQIDH